ncbi:MAG: hypothetical protein J7M40_17400 [Planctomycetes bacterium]|nr:hypothetical protein [Planctomycetota bacterium]
MNRKGLTSITSVWIALLICFAGYLTTAVGQQQLFPPDGAGAVGVDTDLSWTVGSEQAEAYDVYLGTDHDDVFNAIHYRGDIDGSGQVDEGDVESLADCWLEAVSCDSDFDGSGRVDFADFALIASTWLEYDSPEFMTRTTDQSYDPGVLQVGQEYFWRVDGIANESEVSTGDTWSFTTGVKVKDGLFDYVDHIADIDLDGNIVYAINCGSTADVQVGSTPFRGDVYQWKEQSGDTNGDGNTDWWDTRYNATCPGKPASPSPIAGVTVECSDGDTKGMDHGPYEGYHSFDVSGLSGLGDMTQVLSTSGAQNLGNPGERDMIYRLDVTPGKKYKLQLFFFKNSTESTGMDVLVEGNLVIDGLDVPVDVANAGYNKANTVLMYSTIVTATDSQLDIVIKRNSSYNGMGDINAITLEYITTEDGLFDYVDDIADIGLGGNIVYAINCGSDQNITVGSVDFRGDVYLWHNDAGDTNGDGNTDWWDTLYNANCPGKPASPSPIAGVTVECSDGDTNGMDHGPYEGNHTFDVSGISGLGNMAQVLSTSGSQNLGSPGERDMIYRLDVTPGKKYKLQLFFFKNSTDSTDMDVLIEDSLIIDGLDVPVDITNAGHDKANTVLIYSTILTATDSRTDIVIQGHGASNKIGEINAITLAEPTSLTSSTGLKLAGAPDGVNVFNSDGSRRMRFRGFLTNLGMTDTATPSLITYNGDPTIQMSYTTTGDLSITGFFTPIGDMIRIHYDVWADSSPNTGTSSLLFEADGSGMARDNQSLWTRSTQPDGVSYEVVDSHGFRFDFPSGESTLLNLPNANLNWADPWFSNLPLYQVAGDHWATDADWVLIENNIRPTAGPTLVKGRPLALDIWTTQTYNLWNDSASPLPLNTQVFNALPNSQTVTLSWWARDYNDNVITSDSAVKNVAAGAVWNQTLTFPAPAHGILFVEVEATAGAYSVFRRTNLAVLPPYTYGSDRSNSIFGLNGTFGLPDTTSEKALLEQMGVRWLRNSQYSLADAESVGIGQRRHTECNYWDGESDGWFDGQFNEAADKLCPYWELNNEMNFSGHSNPEEYVNNALIPARNRQQAIGSDVDIMIGGLGGWAPSYLQGLYDAGGWPYFDALNIHPGRGNYTPDYTGAFWTFLGIVQNYKNALKAYGSKPLYITEAYGCTAPNKYWYDSYRNAAESVVLSYALAMEEGVEVMDWYQLNDTIGSDVGGVDHEDAEYHFGLLNRDLSPKPSLLAYATIARALDQATFAGRISFDSATKNHGLMFNSPINGNVAVLWNRTDGYVLTQDVPNYAAPEPWIDQWPTKVNVSLPAAGSTVTVIDSIGLSTIVPATNGYANIVLDGAPIIVYGLADIKVDGTGLTGDYFNNSNLTSLALTRIDATVDFPSWGSGSPDPSIGVDAFSVRWSGQVEAKYSETYTFYTKTDDGTRLWVDGQLLVDKWVVQGGTEWSGTITLTAGQKYNIVMEYFENDGGAEAVLRWSSASQSKEIIPQMYLYPTMD